MSAFRAAVGLLGAAVRVAAPALALAVCMALPSPARADLESARVALQAARWAQAQTLLEAHLDTHPDDGGAWHLLGDSLAARGRDAGALAAYRRALALDAPRPLSTRVAAAAVEARTGDTTAAEVGWSAVMNAWRGGGVEDPRELMAVAAAARALGHGDPALRRTALRLYEEAMARAPEDPAPRAALGGLLLASYNNAEALPLFQEALALDPGDPVALLGLARSLHFDHGAGAVDAARAAVAAAPGRVDSRVFLARLLAEEQDPDAARGELEAALAVNPRSPEALSLLAALADGDGDDAAMHALMDLVALVAPRDAEAWVTLAELAADQRRYADAVRYATRAVDVDPRHWRAHALLGMNRLRLGQVAAARDSLERAFRGDPFNVWAKNTLDLLDAMDDYAVVERGRFVLTARADQAAVLAPHQLPLAEAAWDAHARRYRVEPLRPVRIEVHPEHDDLSVRTLGVAGIDLLGVSFGPTVVLDAPMANPSGPFNWGSVLWHELGHTFQLALSRGRAPRWLAEGMAVDDEHRARVGWGQDVGPGFLQAYLDGRLAPASRLNASFLRPASPEGLGHAYLQAGLVVAMIERDHGDEALRALLVGYRDGARTETLLPAVLGLAPAEFDAAFDRYLRERFADALAALAVPAGGEGTSRYAGLLRTAREALEAGDLDAAETPLLEARTLVPGHAGPHGPHGLLAEVYRRRGDRAAEAAALAARAAVDADDLDAVVALADARAALGDAAGEADALARALLIQPFDPALHRRLAEAHEARRDWAAARRERAAVVALGPVDPVQARYRLAVAASRTGDDEGARREILAALEHAPLFEDGLELLLTVRARLAAPAASPAEERQRR